MNAKYHSWQYWGGRLVFFYLAISLSCAILFPVIAYVITPIFLWVFSESPLQLPEQVNFFRWLKYGAFVTVWAGSILWLSEFLPWLIKLLRSRDNSDSE